MQLVINGAYHAINGWVVFKPLVGYEVQDGEYLSIEWWGSAADAIARKYNSELLWFATES